MQIQFIQDWRGFQKGEVVHCDGVSRIKRRVSRSVIEMETPRRLVKMNVAKVLAPITNEDNLK